MVFTACIHKTNVWKNLLVSSCSSKLWLGNEFLIKVKILMYQPMWHLLYMSALHTIGHCFYFIDCSQNVSCYVVEYSTAIYLWTLIIGIPESQIYNKFFYAYSPIEPWRKIRPSVYFILGLLDYAAFYKDKTHYEVCPYADQHENLSFYHAHKVKWVLCYFAIISRPVTYVEYSKT